MWGKPPSACPYICVRYVVNKKIPFSQSISHAVKRLGAISLSFAQFTPTRREISKEGSRLYVREREKLPRGEERDPISKQVITFVRVYSHGYTHPFSRPQIALLVAKVKHRNTHKILSIPAADNKKNDFLLNLQRSQPRIFLPEPATLSRR
jgi:hypothetical protein